jgi:hypothetical protein
MLRLAALLTLAGLLAPTAAHAGRTRFGWLYDTDTVPERGVELETWVLEEDGKGTPAVDETSLWLAPVIGITDRLELALPIEISYTRDPVGARTDLERVGADLRYRLTSPDPVESGRLSALVRLAVKRLVTDRGTVRFEPGGVIALDLGRARLLADLEWVVEVDDAGHTNAEFRPGAGVSVAAVGELRVGAEVYSELALGDTDSVSWVALGPNLSLSHGRFWLVASCPIGLRKIDAAPRLNWAVAF